MSRPIPIANGKPPKPYTSSSHASGGPPNAPFMGSLPANALAVPDLSLPPGTPEAFSLVSLFYILNLRW